MNYKCSKERFLNDVCNHTMTILQDNDLYRHLRFIWLCYAIVWGILKYKEITSTITL